MAPAQPKSVMKRYFVGYSTQNVTTPGATTLYDIQLINIDLMTAFMTRVGERIMRPDWGCKLWNYLMEPWTTTLNDMIIAEVLRICSLDTRLSVVNEVVQIFPATYGFSIAMTLLYQPWLVAATFTANFEQNDMIYYDGASNTNISSLANSITNQIGATTNVSNSPTV